MSAPMVRAILSGAKTQTRRIVKPQPPSVEDVRKLAGIDYHLADLHQLGVWSPIGPVWAVRRLRAGSENEDAMSKADRMCQWRCPYGAPGDRLWVREAFAYSVKDPDSFKNDEYTEEQCDIIYRATSEDVGEWTNYDENGNRTRIAPPWKPSIHMPRWASRITLEVTGVRVERLNDITESDARAEGVDPVITLGKLYPSKYAADVERESYREWFRRLWCRINGAGSWDANPWVWVVEFRRIEEHAT